MAIITPGIDTTTSNGTRATINAEKAANDSSDAAKSKADELKNQFLSILLTQLQNQNPLDPMDTKEFTGQLAQFSSLEQQIDTNSKLDTLLSTLQGNATTSAFTYIGKEATIESNMTTYQDGEADWEYALGGDAKSVKIEVLDAAGNVIFSTTQSNMDQGAYGFEISDSDFNPPPAEGSVLKLKIEAKDANGQDVESAVRTTVLIDGIETTEDGDVDMRAGKLIFSMSDIVKVSSPKEVAETEVPEEETETPDA